MQTMKTRVVIIEIQVENMHLNFKIKSNFFDKINYWTQATFKNNSDTEVKVTHKKHPL